MKPELHMPCLQQMTGMMDTVLNLGRHDSGGFGQEVR